MALATICPHCHTTFRVASDQLKLRGGIVRCGACHEVFDGNAVLVDLDAIPLQEEEAVATPALDAAPEPVGEAAAEVDLGPLPVLDSVVETAEEAEAEAPPEPESEPEPEPESEAEPEAEPESAAQDAPVYILDFDTTLDAATPPATAHLDALPPPDDDGAAPQQDLDELSPGPLLDPAPAPAPARESAVDAFAPLLTRASAAAEDRPGPSTLLAAGQAKNARRQAAAQRRKEALPPPVVEEAPPVEDEPEFVRSSRLREETGATRRMLMAGGAAVLALLLLVQGVWSFRNVWAARYPGARPALSAACAVLGCKVELPAQIDALTVETGELQTLDATTFSFTTLLRNQGELVQAWPQLELALTDANDKTLVRRVFTPAEYLPAGTPAGKGFAERSEQPVKLFFQLNQIKASGYHLAIFYPLTETTMTAMPPTADNKTTLICGSLAFDKIMQYHGRFVETLLADQLHKVNVSFLVPTLRTEYGGCAANIAYNLAMLGGDPLIMATIGQDGGDYLARFAKQGISTRAIRTIEQAYTAQCFVTADQDNNQINAFHPGAMQHSHENHAADCGPLALAIIAPDGRDGMLKHATDLAAQGTPFMFDPGQQLPMFSGEELRDFIGKASYLAANDYEFEMLAERTGMSADDIAAQLDALIVTRGEHGSEIFANGERMLIPAVEAAAVVDPTGCGDAYRAGLLYGIANGLDWGTTGRLASLLGAIKIAHQGGQNHSFTRESIAAQFEKAFGYQLFKPA